MLVGTRLRPAAPRAQTRPFTVTSRRLQQTTPYLQGRGLQPQQPPPPIVVLKNEESSSPRGKLQAVIWYLAGTMTSVVGTYLYVKGFIPGTNPQQLWRRVEQGEDRDQSAHDPSSSQEAGTVDKGPSKLDLTEALYTYQAKLFETQEAFAAKSSEVQNCDAASLRLHKIFIELVTSLAVGGSLLNTRAYRAVRDDALLENPPIPITDDTPLVKGSILVRIIDPMGKNRALILGIDRHKSALDDYEVTFDALEPVWRWLYSVGEELHHAGENADVDLPVYVWSQGCIAENSIAAARANFLFLRADDVPPGFPMKQLRAIRPLSGGSNFIKN